MPVSSPATAPISTICASTAWCMRVVLRSPHAHARIDRHRCGGGACGAWRACGADRRGCPTPTGCSRCVPTVEANVQTGEPFAFAPQPLLAQRQGPPCRRTGRADRRRDAGAGAGCRRARRDGLDAAAGGDHRRRGLRCRTRRRFPPRSRAMSASTGTAGDAAGRRRGVRCRRACRVAAPRQPPHRHQPDGAARCGRQLRCGAAAATR